MAARTLSLLLAGAALLAAAPGRPVLRFVATGSSGTDGPGEFRVLDLPREALARISRDSPDLSGLLRVRACPAPCHNGMEQTLPDLWGRVTVEGDAVIFRPRHAVNAGVELIARFDGAAFDRLSGATSPSTPSLDLRELVPLAPGPAPRVVGIFPSGTSVPENLLRLYVEFSTPMSVRDVEKHVHLLDASGGEIPLAFVEVAGGLWNKGRTRLTLFLHPGRVKEGVAPREAMGPVLQEGQTVRLRIDALARDGFGRTLGVDAGRAWRVGPAQRQVIDPATWRLEAPPGPEAPLVVSFDHALDVALAQGALSVVDENGVPVFGTSTLEDGETRLVFAPQGAWKAGGAYRLLVDPVLEDVSGNRTDRPFERAVRPPSEERARPSPAELRFQAAAELFRFTTNDFWLNLHQYLHVLGRASNGAADASRVAVKDAPADAARGLAMMSAAEQEAWRAAVAFYAAGPSRLDPVFDPPLVSAGQALARARDAKDLSTARLEPTLGAALAGVADIYRRVFWPAHRAANEAWVNELQPLLRAHGPSIVASITRAYASSWPADGYPARVTAYANWAGAFSTDGELLVLSSLDPALRGSQALEVVFHESMHQWDQRTFAALEHAARQRGVPVTDWLSHAMIFFTAGEATRVAVPGHVPYAEAAGVWARGREPLRQSLLSAWKPWLDGRGTREAALEALVARAASPAR